jgi:hypothetical protein
MARDDLKYRFIEITKQPIVIQIERGRWRWSGHTLRKPKPTGSAEKSAGGSKVRPFKKGL